MRFLVLILAVCLKEHLASSSIQRKHTNVFRKIQPDIEIDSQELEKDSLEIESSEHTVSDKDSSQLNDIKDNFSCHATSNKRMHKASSNIKANLKNCPKGSEVTYTAAVLEYEPYYINSKEVLSGEVILRENVKRITGFASDAKSQGADIFVSPEYGVTSLPSIHTNDTKFFLTLTQTIPEPTLGVVPCLDHTLQANYETIRELSCSARNLSMYLVVDLAEQTPCEPSVSVTPCPKHGLTFYNTQVVFDRSGAVVARYRKQNLYMENRFTPGPPSDSSAIFDTDFGVRFSLQICFDITSMHPGYSNVREKGIRDVVMSTAWVDEVPFVLAISFMNGWSRSLGANLMVSGYHWPEYTKLGSGIYRSYSGLASSYTYDPNSGNVLVVAPVTTCRAGEIKPEQEEHEEREMVEELQKPKITKYPRNTSTVQKRRHVVLHDDFSVYNSTVLQTTQKNEKRSVSLCHADGLCCHLRYEHSNSDLVYQLLAFSGVLVKGDGSYRLGAQICGISWCVTENKTTCGAVDYYVPKADEFGPFELEGKFNSEIVFISGMTRNMTLVQGEDLFHVVKKKSNLLKTERPMKNLLSTGLFGRWYSKDE